MEDQNTQTIGKGISGSTLKLIAVITMLIDHIGATIVMRMLLAKGNGVLTQELLTENSGMYLIYFALRSIGRIAFPIFCFLMVEGLQKTHNKWKYVGRMLLFSVISEVPFDLALSSNVFYPGYQNVFFTLTLGLLSMIVGDYIEHFVAQWAENRTADGQTASSRHNRTVKAMYGFLIGLDTAVFAVMAELLHTDYGAIGVVCIMVLYLFRKQKITQLIAGCVIFMWEIPASVAFLPIAFYNGKRGWKLKYFFYAFYPVHLLILYFICVAMGIGMYPAV